MARSPLPASRPTAPTDTAAVFLWRHPKITFKGLRNDVTRDMWFKLRVKWRHSKKRGPKMPFIPTKLSSAGRKRAHCDPVQWLLILGLWCNVLKEDADLWLLLSKDEAVCARSKLRAGQPLNIRQEKRNLPVLLANWSSIQWCQLDNANIQPLTYRHAARTLKQLARHPHAMFSGLQLYNLQETFLTSMAGRIVEHYLQLLMGHRQFGAHTALTAYQQGLCLSTSLRFFRVPQKASCTYGHTMVSYTDDQEELMIKENCSNCRDNKLAPENLRRQ